MNFQINFYELFIFSAIITYLHTTFTSATKNFPHVTCGSVIKLANGNYHVRLHSHDIKYGSGSGQQSVTGTETGEDVNSYWAVKGLTDKPCQRGVPIECGASVRLEHLQTKKNLHSHLFSSPLSGNQEVSAFGKDGEGDTGDNWNVICSGDYWERGSNMRLKHTDTEMFLSVSGHTYGRPIHGQIEVVGVQYPDSASYWKTMEGIYINPSEEKTFDHVHNEL